MREIIIELSRNTNKGKAPRPLRFVENENGCWINMSHTKDRWGYGWITRRVDGIKKGISVHRYMYERFNGEIPQGYVVRHKCDNPCCGNPEHLEVGTHKDNMEDKVKRGRGTRKKIIQLDLNNKEIREFEFVTEVSKYGFDPSAVIRVCKGKSKHHKNYIWKYKEVS